MKLHGSHRAVVHIISSFLWTHLESAMKDRTKKGIYLYLGVIINGSPTCVYKYTLIVFFCTEIYDT